MLITIYQRPQVALRLETRRRRAVDRSPLNGFWCRTRDEEYRAGIAADKAWWQARLPPGYPLVSWTDRSTAEAYSPDQRCIVELDARRLCELAGRDCEKETARGR
jgi:hypothetical protein